MTCYGPQHQYWLASTALAGFAMAAFALPTPALANPTGGQVVGGKATITAPNPQTVVINQTSQRAIIDWLSFSIKNGELVQFLQKAGVDSITINRVIGGDPSVIAGVLKANGIVVLINGSGVTFAKGSEVDVNGLIVSAADITNANAMAGNMKFDVAPSHPGATIVNDGHITVGEHGFAALVAPGVVNNGIIAAKLGKVVLAGTETFTADLYGDGLISFDVGQAVTQAPDGPNGEKLKALVTNTGVITADGGHILLTADAIEGLLSNLVQANGTLTAESVGAKAGSVSVTATGGNASVGGMIDVAGLDAGSVGGAVKVTGQQVDVLSTARIDARGSAGGGTIDVGGGRHGADITVPNADETTVERGAVIEASAIARGNGGTIVVWSGEHTSFGGSVSARGGAYGGNGGFIETSSGNQLTIATSAQADTLARNGATGTWLLDPKNFVIAKTGGTETPADVVKGLAKNDVLISADNDITVADPVDATTNAGATHNLIFEAGRSILIDAGITMNGGSFIATANDSADFKAGLVDRDTGAGSFTMAAGAAIDATTGGGSITLAIGNTTTNPKAGGKFTAGTMTLLDLSAADTVTLTTTGTASEAAGNAITAGTLSLQGAGGQFALAGTGNDVGTLQAATGAITLNDSGNTTQLTLAGVAATGTLSITTGGALAQTAGKPVTGGGSSFTAGGNITLANLGDDFDTVAGTNLVASGANLTFLDKTALTLGNIAATGTLSVTSKTALSQATGATITAGGGSFDAGAANITLANVGNDFDTTVGGSVTATGAAISLRDKNTLTLGAITATGALTLRTGGALTQAAGTAVDAAGTTINATGDITLANAGNDFDTGAGNSLSATGDAMTLRDKNALTLNAVHATGTLGITSDGLLTVDTVSSTGAATLISAAGITENPIGGITTPTLTAQAQSGINLGGTGNGVVALGGLTTQTGNIALTDANSLTIGSNLFSPGMLSIAVVGATSDLTVAAGAQIVSVGNLTLNAQRNLTLNGAAASDLISGPATTTSLIAGAALDINGGVAGYLLTLSGATLNFGVGNQIISAVAPTLLPSPPTSGTPNESTAAVAGTTVTLAVGGSLITPLYAPGGTVNLNGILSPLSVAAPIVAQTVSLDAFGSITEGGGSITATNLSASSTLGDIALTGTNKVANVTGLSAIQGSIGFDDSQDLAVTGAVNGLSTVNLTSTGSLSIGGAVTGGTIVLDGPAGLSLAAGINGSTVTLEASGGMIGQTAGVITAADLGATAATGISLNGANAITTVTGLSSTSGPIVLDDATNLTISGAVGTTGNVTLSSLGFLEVDGSISAGSSASLAGATGLTLAANVGATTISLASTAGTIGQSTGILTATDLGATSGTGISLVSANKVGTLTAASGGTGGVTFDDSQDLIVGGTVSGGGALDVEATGSLTIDAAMSGGASLTLAGASGLTLAADLGATTVALTSSAGTVTQNSGTITATTLSGSGATGISLTDANKVTTVTGLSGNAGGAAFDDTQDLTIAGTVSATGAVSIASTGALTIASSVTGGPSLILTGASGLTLGNDIGATTVTLGSDGGTISQSAGIITATSLGASAAKGISLTDANRVGTVTSLAGNAGGIAFDDGQDLTISGPVGGSGAVSIASTGTLIVDGAVTSGPSVILDGATGLTLTADVGATTVDLGSTSGTISQSAGIITATNFQAIAGGGIDLAGANKIANVVELSDTSGDVFLQDTQDLTISGAISSAGSVSIFSAGTLGIDASVTGGPSLILEGSKGLTLAADIGATTITLTSTSGAIGQTAGIIAATNLDASAASGITLTDANQVATVTGLNGNTGGVGFIDNQNLTITGAVSGSGAVTLSSAGSLTVDAAVTGGPAIELDGGSGLSLAADIGATTVTLTSTTGAIDQTGGIITATNLGATAGFGISLTDGNKVATVTGFTGNGGGVAFDDSRDLTIGGAVSGSLAVSIASTGMLNVDAAVTGGPSLELDGVGGLSLAANLGATTVTLTATGGTIGQTAGVITASSLGASAGNGISLTDANQVATVTGLTGNTGGVAFEDTQDLTIAGTVSGSGAVSIASSGSLTVNAAVTGGPSLELDGASGLSLTADLAATTVTLSSTGGTIGQSAGVITATKLGASSASGISLTDANQVATLTGLSGNAGGVAFDDGRDLTIAGAVGGAGAVSITSTGSLTIDATVTGGSSLDLDGVGGLSLAANVGATSVTLTSETGSIGQTAGVITATDLAASAATGISLADSNAVEAVTGLTTTAGNIAFDDGQDLTVSGAVTAPGSVIVASTGTLSVDALVTGGPSLTLSGVTGLTLGADIGATTVTLAGGTIAQTAGVIAATNLSASAGDAVSLTDANQVATVTALTATTGDIAFTDSQNLAVTGPITVIGDQVVTLTDTGGSISGTGVLSANYLDVAASGGIDLTGANKVVNVVGMTADSGGITFLDSQSLAISGVASAPGAVVITATGSLTVDASVTGGPSVALTGKTGLDLAADIQATTVTLAGGTGAILQDSGIITAQNLSGTAHGTIALGDANLVGAVTGLSSTTGAITFDDNQDLTLAGPISAAGAVLVTTSGTLDVAAAVTGGPSVELDGTNGLSLAANVGATTISLSSSGGAIDQTAGVLSGQNLGVTAQGNIALGDTNAIATVTGMTSAAGDVTLLDGVNLTVAGALTGAGNVSLTADKLLTVDAGVTGGPSVTLNGHDNLMLEANVTAASVSLNSVAGAVLQTAGIVTANNLGGSASGGITLPDTNLVANVTGLTSTTGGILLEDGQSLTVSGPVAAGPGGGNQITLATSAGDIDIESSVTAGGEITVSSFNDIIVGGAVVTGTELALSAGNQPASTGGNIYETGSGSIHAATLTGSSPGWVSLALGSNTVAVLDGFSALGKDATTTDGATRAAGSFAFADQSGLILTGLLRARSDVSISAEGTISEQGAGAINAASLDLSARRGIQLAGKNQVGELGDVSLNGTGDFVFNDLQSLTILDPLVNQHGNIRFTVAGDFLSDENIDASAALTVEAGGQIKIENASLTAGTAIDLTGTDLTFSNAALDAMAEITLTGTEISLTKATVTAGTDAVFTGTGLVIANSQLTAGHDIDATIGGVISIDPSTITSGNDISLIGTGIGIAGASRVAAGHDLLLSAGLGNLEIDGGTVLAKREILLGAKNITQTGTSTFGAQMIVVDVTGLALPDLRTALDRLDPISLANPADVLNLIHPGSIVNGDVTLDHFDAGKSSMVISAYGGIVKTIPGGYLTVGAFGLSMPGGIGQVDLTGTISDIVGPAAAQKSQVVPGEQNNNYRFDNCPVGTASCTVLPPLVPIKPQSAEDVEFIQEQGTSDDIDVEGPNTNNEDIF